MRRGLLRLLTMSAAMIAIVCVVLPAQAQVNRSDAVRLQRLPPGFKRLQVWVLPVLDQRQLTGPGATSPVWRDFIEALAQYRNLRVRRPDRTRTSIAAAKTYKRVLPLARRAARQGMADYQRVRLKQAAVALREAVTELIGIGHHLVAPAEVGRLELTRGLALLEADARGADNALQRALLIDPGLRLVPGVDRQEAIDALERVRRGLNATLPAVEALFTPGPPVPKRVASIQSRLTASHLEVVLRTVDGRVVVDRQPLDAPDAGARLAARIWACLPFGRGIQRRATEQQLYLDAGFDSFIFIESPTELVRHVGVTVNASWSVARFLAFDANLALTNSGRDREEDLRSDVPVGRLTLGPSFVSTFGRLRLTASLGVEVSTIASLTITTNPDCKFRGVGRFCDAEEFERFETNWNVGGALTLGATVRASESIYLGVRLRGASYVFESVDNGLDLPVGGQLVLGYRLF